MTGGFAAVLADLDLGDVELRRAWPRSPAHLLLDLLDHRSGQRVAGQWLADPAAAAGVAAATPGAERRGRLVLQPAGADRALIDLGPLVRRPGSRLVAHRPERRAVVELDGGARYAKLVGARRAERLRGGCLRAGRLPIPTPRLAPDDGGAVVTTLALPGVPLAEVLAGPRAAEALAAVGAAIAALHRAAPPPTLAAHGPGEEVAVSREWEARAGWYGLDLSEQAAVTSIPPPAPIPPPPPVPRPIHRDLHDGQLLLEPDDQGRFHAAGVGLLDFDLLAAGDPALDLGNLIEHLWLRSRQGVLADPVAATEALLDGYRPDPGMRDRLPGYRALAARRLAAVYAFRSAARVT